MGQFNQILPIDSMRIAKTAIESAKLHSLSETAYNAWVNGALSFVGSIIGALVAVWIAVWTLQRSSKMQHKNDELKNFKLRQDKLRYFCLLVNSVINTTLTNNTHLSESIKAINSDKVNFHPLTITPNSDLKRISEVIELESYMLAFSNEPKINKGVEEFGIIMNNVDYLYNEFRVLPDLVERAGNITSKNQLDIKEIFEEIRKILQQIMANRENYNAEVVNNLMMIYNNVVLNSSITIDFLYHHAFIPFNSAAIEALLIKQDEQLESLAYLSLNGRELYQNLIRENENYLEILNSIQVRISEAYNELLIANQVQKMFLNG